MERIAILVRVFVMTFIGALFIGFLLSWPVMMLWNYCLVPAVGVKSITWLQAWGLFVLSNLLFKSTSSKNSS